MKVLTRAIAPIAVAATVLLAGCGGQQSVQTPSTTSTLTTEVNTSPVTTTLSPTANAS